MAEVKRSKAWPLVAWRFKQKNPRCAACSEPKETHSVQVHHIIPFHYIVALGRPDLELDPRNLITLCETTAKCKCENHHLLLGHLGDFQSFNPNVVADALRLKGGTSEAIKKDPGWKTERSGRVKLLEKMTDKDKVDFKAMLDKLFPIK